MQQKRACQIQPGTVREGKTFRGVGRWLAVFQADMEDASWEGAFQAEKTGYAKA